jgi:CheY-like chemotaxis protein/HPt (histidine-containing phosphotransfer) domain-containing protein
MLLHEETSDCQILNVNCSPLLGNEGKYRGVMVTFDDVTQLERNKAELKSAKEEADAANQAKSDFLANISHEIRNPMNAIVGFTDVLRRGLEDGPESRCDYLNTIHSSGTHLVGLINDILDLSKIEAGRMEVAICEWSPWQVLTEVVAVMGGKAQENGIELKCEIRGLIPATIQSDPTRLRQIRMNLVSNAIKFTHQGSIRIVAETREENGAPHLRFEVIDTGIGMTPEQADRVFEEFVQADSSVTRRFGGTGLGLAISKRLTEALGGQITVTSEIDSGSTFSFSVATNDLAGVAMLNIEQAWESVKSGYQQQVGLQIAFMPARILVTDDTPANRKLVGLVLRKAGLTVDEAENGLEAVEMASTTEYDLALMDMQMPVMDGFTATSMLREKEMTLPVIALTANVMQSDRERCYASGCTGFLTKPIDIDQLLRTLAEYLQTTDLPVEEPTTEASLAASPLQIPAIASVTESATSATTVLSEGAVVQRADIDKRRVLVSTLPTEIPEFREIVEQFVDGLEPMIEELHHAWQNRNFEELTSLAHRLKGTGGTVGFADFTAPAERLQRQAEANAEDEIEDLLATLSDLSAAVQRPEPAAT